MFQEDGTQETILIKRTLYMGPTKPPFSWV